ncbi:hypothetical protein LJB76_00570 [Clostridia bacterium OttesenSCG-928-O13]|nr:hypothetical protein [Clostridia bacterium OttesenSCG-928-O13]
MRLTSAMPWQQQVELKQQKKQGITQDEETRPVSLRQKSALGGKKQAFQAQGMSLADMLQGMIPGDFASAGKTDETTGAKQIPEAVRKKLGEIGNKMKSGQALSPKEMELLEKHDPVAYQKAKQIQAERAQYQRELEQCKSKEDVQKLRQRKVAQFSSEVQSVTQSDMSHDDKVKAMELIGMRMANADKVFARFTESAKYKRLPDSAEQKQPRQDKVEFEEETDPIRSSKPRQELEESGVGQDLPAADEALPPAADEAVPYVPPAEVSAATQTETIAAENAAHTPAYRFSARA